MRLAHLWMAYVAVTNLLTGVQASETTTSLRITTAPQVPTRSTTTRPHHSSTPAMQPHVSQTTIAITFGVTGGVTAVGAFIVLVVHLIHQFNRAGCRCRQTGAHGVANASLYSRLLSRQVRRDESSEDEQLVADGHLGARLMVTNQNGENPMAKVVKSEDLPVLTVESAFPVASVVEQSDSTLNLN